MGNAAIGLRGLWTGGSAYLFRPNFDRGTHSLFLLSRICWIEMLSIGSFGGHALLPGRPSVPVYFMAWRYFRP